MRPSSSWKTLVCFCSTSCRVCCGLDTLVSIPAQLKRIWVSQSLPMSEGPGPVTTRWPNVFLCFLYSTLTLMEPRILIFSPVYVCNFTCVSTRFGVFSGHSSRYVFSLMTDAVAPVSISNWSSYSLTVIVTSSDFSLSHVEVRKREYVELSSDASCSSIS